MATRICTLLTARILVSRVRINRLKNITHSHSSCVITIPVPNAPSPAQ
jgi:hypothetical protein